MNTRIFDRLLNVAAVFCAFAVMYGFAVRSVVLSFPGVRVSADADSMMFYIMQGMVLISLIGSLNAYRSHRKIGPPILAIVSTAAVIYGINSQLDIYYMFPGMVGMLVVSAWNSIEARRIVAEVE